MLRISVCVAVLFVLACCLLPMAAPAQQAPSPMVTTYYGCVNNSTGAIRIVSKNTACKSTEHKIDWNQAGPQGPQGPKGPQGAQGPAGPQGPPGVSVGYSASASSVELTGYPGVLVTQTTAVSAGTYYVSASELLLLISGDSGFCYITTADNEHATHNYGGTGTGGTYAQVSNTDVWSVSEGDAFQLFCYDGLGSGSDVYNAMLTATLINSASDSIAQPRKNIPPPGTSKH